MIKRYLEQFVSEGLREKMAFISGPRQVGKTTLAKQIGDKFYAAKYAYLNWDNRYDRKLVVGGGVPADNKLIIFDEIHKYRNWKNYLKGEYDKHKDKFNILVTGSARLDIYRKGGDSLLGRYYSYRLHPLSLAELLQKKVSIPLLKGLIFGDGSKDTGKLCAALLKFGGFPEPFTKQSDKTLRLWHNQRIDRLVKEDIRDIENVRDISSLQILAELLPSKVGSLFSLNSLKEDLGVTHKTIASWMDIFEKFYYHFRIYPFQSSLIKSLRKEPKLYLWDWSEVKDEDSRLENMVASHLLKFCHFLFDVEGYKARLFFIRDAEQREIDFVVVVDNKPWFSVEAKRSFKGIPSSLRYFGHRLKIPFMYQVVGEEDIDIEKDNIRVISVGKFLTGLV